LTAQALEFTPFIVGERLPRLRSRRLNPGAQAGHADAEVPRDRGNRLVARGHQPDRFRFELRTKSAMLLSATHRGLLRRIVRQECPRKRIKSRSTCDVWTS